MSPFKQWTSYERDNGTFTLRSYQYENSIIKHSGFYSNFRIIFQGFVDTCPQTCQNLGG